MADNPPLIVITNVEPWDVLADNPRMAAALLRLILASQDNQDESDA